MSLTQSEHLFAGIHEAGVNDLFRAFFTARPRYLLYGTAAFVPATTINATNVPTISFFGQTIHYQITVGLPIVDIVPGGTSALTPGPGEFIIKTRVTGTFLFGNITLPPVTLEVLGLCEPKVVSSTPGTGTIGINLKRVEIVDITPDPLETLIEQFALLILQGVLQNLQIPFNTFTAGAFGLILLDGPRAETDQFKVRGNAL